MRTIASFSLRADLRGARPADALIDERTAAGVASRLRVARSLLEQATAAVHPSRSAVEMANHGTMFGDDELKWTVGQRFRVGLTLLESLAGGLAEEVVHTAARLAGHYDTAAICRPDLQVGRPS